MKCRLYIIVLLIGNYSSSILFSQDAQFRVISCSGDVFHQLDTSSRKIVSGVKIEPVGKLIVGKDSKIKLICKDKPHQIEDSGEYNLAEIYSGSASQSMSFTGKFWKFIMEGLRSSDSKTDLKAYHKNYGSISGGIKGYTSSDKGVQIIHPFSGKITGTDFVIAWVGDRLDSVLTVHNYSVRIENTDDRFAIFETSTAQSSYAISAKDCAMILGNSYYIKVTNEAGEYDEMKFQYVELDDNKVNRRLESLVDYDNATEKEKLWMKATVLEMEDYKLEAESIYNELKKKYPDDGYLKKLYLLFMTRNNQLERIESLN